ncbi:MAG: prepilin-type N-terminal cleavage/methylation domain-containing protein [Verrucomicrobia bacterium]|nr:prepilin-type N-terminal cleavage/methylation domain-containing protein [Verrucomicrobiota bacterium]
MTSATGEPVIHCGSRIADRGFFPRRARSAAAIDSGINAGRALRPAREKSAIRNPRSAIESRAFTLLEIILAIAVLALLAGVLVSASADLIGDKPVSAEDVFWKATQRARAAALNGEHEVRLSFEPKDKVFILDDGVTPQKLALPPGRDAEVDFLAGQATGNSILVGGELMESKPIPFVTFYPDGTCSSFRVQFRAGNSARVVAIDPWTCAKILPPTDGGS